MFKPALLTSLTLYFFVSLAHASSFEDALIKGVRFLDGVPEVEWYHVKGKSLIIGWKSIPQTFPHTNRKAALRATKITNQEIHVWAVRHNQKKWSVGSGESYICLVTARNGHVKKDNCLY